MQIKKNPKADLSKNSNLYFAIGLAVILFISWRAIEWKTYNTWFDWMYQKYKHIFESSHILYLKCKPEVSYERLRKRDRNEEKKIDLEYIKQIHEKHESWLNKATNVEIIDGEQNLLEDFYFNSFILKLMIKIKNIS